MLTVLTGLLAAGCYDHSVTQAIMERRRRAKAAEGAKLRASPGGMAQHVDVKQGCLRFYVTQTYRHQHSDWKSPLRNMVDDVNANVGPNFGVKFQVTAIVEWNTNCDPAQLEGCLAELEKLDAGEDGDWIVGVLGAMPSFTESFDLLGMARPLGRHFLIRDVSDLAERAAIDQAFAAFLPARRDEIYKRRKSHKRVTVFLHEWAHTLGGLHVDDKASLLNPAYDDRMEAFDNANQGLVAASLTDRFRYSGTHGELTAYLQGSASAGLPSEGREKLLARLSPPAVESSPGVESNQSVGGEAGPVAVTANHEAAPIAAPLPKHAFVIDGDEGALLAKVEPADRATYQEAVKLTVSGNSYDALTLLEPVAKRYPDNYAVQHLTCGLAMQTGWQALAQKVCPRVQGLASGK
jgi:hypothetical protein